MVGGGRGMLEMGTRLMASEGVGILVRGDLQPLAVDKGMLVS